MLEKINGNIENLNSQKWQEAKKLAQKIRPTGIGGTDANKLVHGETWLDLYNEKLGHTEPVDLSDVLPVQMGIHTEDLNRRWFMKQSHNFVTEEQTLWYNDYIYGTVDGIVHENVDNDPNAIDTRHGDPFAVFEAKHTHAFNLSEKKQVEQLLNIPITTVRPRFSELVGMKLIIDLKQTRKNESGKNAIVWGIK
jgi:hypothetical protein